jgi:chaperonin GroES
VTGIQNLQSDERERPTGDGSHREGVAGYRSSFARRHGTDAGAKGSPTISSLTAGCFPAPEPAIFRAGPSSQLGVAFMDVRPLHDRIIVRRLEEGEQTRGAIIIPDTAKEKPQRGEVIAAGSGKVKDNGKRVPLDVKPGDQILFGKYTSQEVKLDGEDYLIMREDEVLAVLDGAATTHKR